MFVLNCIWTFCGVCFSRFYCDLLWSYSNHSNWFHIRLFHTVHPVFHLHTLGCSLVAFVDWCPIIRTGFTFIFLFSILWETVIKRTPDAWDSLERLNCVNNTLTQRILSHSKLKSSCKYSHIWHNCSLFIEAEQQKCIIYKQKKHISALHSTGSVGQEKHTHLTVPVYIYIHFKLCYSYSCMPFDFLAVL